MDKKTFILEIGTAVPNVALTQAQSAVLLSEHATRLMGALPAEATAQIENLCLKSAIETRYSCRSADTLGSLESTHGRNEIYKIEAPKLAIAAVERLLGNQRSLSPRDITHVISVSCTGVMAPSLEVLLIRHFDMDSKTARFGLNMMGCFGAFRGIAMARALALESPVNKVLVVCTELCSLHYTATLDPELLVGNVLFGDGAAALVVSQKSSEAALFEIGHSASTILPETEN